MPPADGVVALRVVERVTREMELSDQEAVIRTVSAAIERGEGCPARPGDLAGKRRSEPAAGPSRIP